MAFLRRLFANWPLKLTSVLLALLLWVIATLEEPISRRVRAGLELEPPAERTIVGAPAMATVQLTAPAREFIKLGTRPVTVLKTVTDTAEGPRLLTLATTDVILPRGVEARALDVQPGQLNVRVVPQGGAATRTRAWHGVPVVVAGPMEERWIAVPDTVTVVVRGPAARLATLDAESVVVLARADTVIGAAALRVLIPAGLTGEAKPDAVRLQPRRN